MILKEICEINIEGGNRKLGNLSNLPLKTEPLELVDQPIPEPGPKDIIIKVSACGVCRTEIDQIEGRIEPPKLPIILGHQPVGIIVNQGEKVTKFKIGDKAGATWIFSSCGHCKFCKSGMENLFSNSCASIGQYRKRPSSLRAKTGWGWYKIPGRSVMS